MLSQTLRIYKRSFSGLTPATWYLALVMLVNRSGTMVMPFLSMYLTQRLGMGLDRAGIILAVFGLGAVCGALLGGRLTDKIGFATVQFFSLLGGGILFIILGQLQGFYPIAICVFALSLVNEAFRPANQTATAHHSKPENRTRSFTLNRLAVNIGWALGSAIGGFLTDYNYSLLFWVDGCTNIMAAVLLWRFFPFTARFKKVKTDLSKPKHDVPSVFNDTVYLLFVLLTVLFAISFFQLFATQPVFFKTEWALSGAQIGWVMALNGIIIAFVEMPLVRHFDGRVNNLYFIAAGTLLIGLSFAILNTSTPGFGIALVSCLLVTFGEMLSMPFMNAFWVKRSVDENRGQYASLYTAAYSFAHVVGTFSGAMLADNFGYRWLWWVVGILSLVTATGYWRLHFINQRGK
jgi:predicted MFS family arabinose efflux permease